MMTKKGLSRLLNNYRKTHGALMTALDRICKKSISKYNNDERNHTKIEKCRTHTSNWHPDQKVIDVDVQIWIEGSWQNMYAAESACISEAFESILNKPLPSQKGFKFNSYVQNVTISSEDD